MTLNDRQRTVLRAMLELGAVDMLAAARGARIGEQAELPEVTRHGNGAVAGSWSGVVSEGLVVATTLRALKRRGLVKSWQKPNGWTTRSTDAHYWLTDAGREVVE